MPKLTNWSVSARPSDPYQAPEFWGACLVGEVSGHPRFNDGETITTSLIENQTPDGKIITASGSVYELLDIDPGYEKEYPNARVRLLDTIKNLKS